MKHVNDQRIPWWGLLIEGEATVVAPLVAIAIEDANGDLVLVPGNGWTGVWSLCHDEPHRKLAEAVRAAGREVIILEWGELEALVWRWNGSQWCIADEDPTSLAEAHGVFGPGSGHVVGRPLRFAALIEGARLEEVAAAARRAEHVIDTPRGPVVLDEEPVSAAFAERPSITVYQVTSYLDNGEFRCGILRLDHVAVYDVPLVTETASGIPVLSDIEGETDPRAIVRRLGLPEDYLFPKERM